MQKSPHHIHDSYLHELASTLRHSNAKAPNPTKPYASKCTSKAAFDTSPTTHRESHPSQRRLSTGLRSDPITSAIVRCRCCCYGCYVTGSGQPARRPTLVRWGNGLSQGQLLQPVLLHGWSSVGCDRRRVIRVEGECARMPGNGRARWPGRQWDVDGG